jgi:hypothetical protein
LLPNAFFTPPQPSVDPHTPETQDPDSSSSLNLSVPHIISARPDPEAAFSTTAPDFVPSPPVRPLYRPVGNPPSPSASSWSSTTSLQCSDDPSPAPLLYSSTTATVLPTGPPDQKPGTVVAAPVPVPAIDPSDSPRLIPSPFSTLPFSYHSFQPPSPNSRVLLFTPNLPPGVLLWQPDSPQSGPPTQVVLHIEPASGSKPAAAPPLSDTDASLLNPAEAPGTLPGAQGAPPPASAAPPAGEPAAASEARPAPSLKTIKTEVQNTPDVAFLPSSPPPDAADQ